MIGPLRALWDVAPTRMRLELALSAMVEILKTAEAHHIKITFDNGKYEIILNKLN